MLYKLVCIAGGICLLFSISTSAGEDFDHSFKLSVDKKIGSSLIGNSDFIEKELSTINDKFNILIESNSYKKELARLTQEISSLKVDTNHSNSYQLVNEKIRGLESEHSTIFNVMTLLMSAIAIFGLGGAVYSLWEVNSMKKKYQKILNNFSLERDAAIDDFKENSKELLLQFDNTQRITRLTHMLNSRNFDGDIFYPDLTQLSQHPSPLMSDLVELIVTIHKNEFEDDVVRLAENIKNRI